MKAVLEAVRAEWGKTWSLSAPWWCLGGAALLTAATAFSLANDFVIDVRAGVHPAGAVISIVDVLGPAIQLGQLAVVALAMLVVTTEYATGSIRSTFQARPQRSQVLVAKSVVVTAVGLVSGAALAAAGWIVAAVALGGHAAPGSAVAVVGRIAVMVGAGCALTAAIGWLLRSGTATLTVAFVVLVGLSVLSSQAAAFTPAGAAVAFIADDSSLYPAWVGAVVMLAWVAVAHIGAAVVLSRRDA